MADFSAQASALFSNPELIAQSSGGLYEKSLAVGNNVGITLPNREIEGTVLAYESASGVVVLELLAQPSVVVLSLKDIERVRSIEVAPSTRAPFGSEAVDHRAIEDRLRKAILKRKQESTKIGVDVSIQAQMLFDYLDPVWGCQWNGDIIVVSGTHQIVAPYRAEDCHGSSTSIDRLKAVVEEARTRLNFT